MVRPEEGMWQGGTFKFDVTVPEDYNIKVSLFLALYALHVFFFIYKHMKFRIQARLCLAIYDFEARIMLNFLRYQATGMRKI